MCGIVGYLGFREAAPLLLEGLSKLEYRGYDSAGIAILNTQGIEVNKCKGRLSNLEKRLEEVPIKGNIGIGHTRWATHGEPSDVNSHPHCDSKAVVSVVHNGIIENYLKLREWLTSKGYQFLSETDTEVIPNLIDYYYKGDLLEAVTKAVAQMEGSYAIGVICSKEPDKIVAVRKDSPLIVGLGHNETFIASDIPAILNYTRDVYLLDDKEFALIGGQGVSLFNELGEKIHKEIYKITWNVDSAEKGGYEDFMLKEIHEQPKAIKDTMISRVKALERINLDDISITKEYLDNIDKIYVVACGTASYAGLVGKHTIEKLARIPVEADVASEFRYRNPIVTEKTLIIVVSQSGETADTLAVLREGKKKGARVLAITNVVGSSISREADDVLYTWAGPEIAVASTKAFITQLVAFYMIALRFSELKETLSQEEMERIKSEMFKLPDLSEEVLKNKDVIQRFASRTYMERDMFFLGRGLDYALSMEGALKLKEISYIHADAYAGGELKHGPIALIEDGTVVIALATQEAVIDKMISNIKEVVSRGAKVIAIAVEGNEEIGKVSDSVIYLPKIYDLLTPVLAVIPLQLLAYYIAKQKNCDVDKPRNLAKSVTVE